MLVSDKLTRFVLWVLFISCMILLTRYILFKKSPLHYGNNFIKEYRQYSIGEGWHAANLKPFATIRRFYNARRMRPEYKYSNLAGNFIGFMPLGFLLPLLFVRQQHTGVVMGSVFLFSLFFETTQLITGLGIFDIDDLILNTAGGMTGFLLVWIWTRLIRKPGVK